MTPDTPPSPPATHPLARKIVLLFVATLTIMAGTTIAPSLPAIEARYADVPDVALLSRMVLTLSSLFVALFAPMAGLLADRYGRKRLLVGAIALYGIAGASGLVVDSLPALLAGRAALGLAIGTIMTVSTALIGDYFAGTERERYLGLQQAFTQLGGVAFVMGGGLLAELHWRLPFAIYGIAFLLVPAALCFLTEPPRARKTQDAQAPADTAGVNWAGVGIICLLAFLVNISFYTIPSQLPFHMKAMGMQDASSFGLVIGVFNLTGALAALGFGLLKRRLHSTSIFTLGFALMTAGFALLYSAGALPPILLATATMGAGVGIIVPNIMSSALSQATPRLRGRIAGMVTASMFIGHFCSPFVSQRWVAASGYVAMFQNVAMVLAGLAILSLLAALRAGLARSGDRALRAQG